MRAYYTFANNLWSCSIKLEEQWVQKCRKSTLRESRLPLDGIEGEPGTTIPVAISIRDGLPYCTKQKRICIYLEFICKFCTKLVNNPLSSASNLLQFSSEQPTTTHPSLTLKKNNRH